jgi:hypothetical protein
VHLILQRYEALDLMMSDGRRYLSLASWAKERQSVGVVPSASDTASLSPV